MPYTMEDSVRELARQLRQLRAAGLPRNPDMIVFPPLDMPKPILHLPCLLLMQWVHLHSTLYI